MILKIKYCWVFLIVIMLCAPSMLFSQDDNTQLYKFRQFFNYINSYYVDTVNSNELIEDAMVAILKELDPHSIYIKKNDVEKVTQPLEGSFDGIGIVFNILKDTIIIVTPIAGGPSEKEGIKAGDRVVRINGEDVTNLKLTTEMVKNRLMGVHGTDVVLSIKRKGVRRVIDFTITRQKIPIFSLDASYMVDRQTGYIKINRFAANTISEFETALSKLKNEGVQNLILDLRDNGGGYLNTAIEMADEFLPKDKLIVYTEGEKSYRTEYRATSRGDFETGKLVVLIDEGSASASEILCGAVQDWDRGVIIGRRSFGKGLVQRSFTLIDGSMIRLTIARYFTPTGRLIQKPYNNGVDNYRNDIKNRIKNGELVSKDSIHLNDSLKFYTLSKKRLVFGGGGIMPDIFVAMDTLKMPDFYQKWNDEGIVNLFIISYIDANRDFLSKKYPDFKIFRNEFVTDKRFLQDFINFCYEEENKKKIEKSFKPIISDLKPFETKITTQLKASIARDLWTVSEYYQIINEISPVFQKAISVLNDKELYEAELK